MNPSTLLPTTGIGTFSFPKWLDHVRDPGTEEKLTSAQVNGAHDNAPGCAIANREATAKR
jgi:hypothetical protein